MGTLGIDGWIIILFIALIKIHNIKNSNTISGNGGLISKRDYVKDDMRIIGVSMEMTSDRREWKKKTCCADPT
jgi:hypothetical protein